MTTCLFTLTLCDAELETSTAGRASLSVIKSSVSKSLGGALEVTGTAIEGFCNPSVSEAMLRVKSRVVNNCSLSRAAVRPLQRRSFKGHYVKVLFHPMLPYFQKPLPFFALSPLVRATCSLTLRRLMSYIYIYGAPILDVSRSHTTTQHSR